MRYKHILANFTNKKHKIILSMQWLILLGNEDETVGRFATRSGLWTRALGDRRLTKSAQTCLVSLPSKRLIPTRESKEERQLQTQIQIHIDEDNICIDLSCQLALQTFDTHQRKPGRETTKTTSTTIFKYKDKDKDLPTPVFLACPLRDNCK